MKIRNLYLLTAISLLVSFFYFYITPGYLHPAEDASILFNYAQNLYETGVISYYPGGPRVDGSTDFAFMLMVSLAMYVVPDTYYAALLVSAISSIILTYITIKLIDTKSIYLQFLVLLLIFFSQQIWAAVLGYGTFFFAMSIMISVWAYWKGSLNTLYMASAFACLCRPDAIITVGPLMLHKLWGIRRGFLKNVRMGFILFGLPMVIYVAFRYFYFGRILPLSFDINVEGQNKILGLIHPHSFHHVKSYALYYIYPGLIGLLFYIAKRKFKLKVEYYVVLFSMVILPMLAYMMIRENLDFSRRYFIVPYLGVVVLMGLLIRNYKSITLSFFALFLLFKVTKTSLNEGVKSLNHYYNNVIGIGEGLSQYPELRLATSEAGLITWKSRLETMDLWGLNTEELTHRIVTKEDIQAWETDLIYIHAAVEDYVYLEKEELSSQKSWLNMTHQVVTAMHEDGYLTYLVPYDSRTYNLELEATHLGLLKSLLKFISESNRTVSSRKDLVAIHPNSKRKAELIQLIEKHGGESFSLHKKL